MFKDDYKKMMNAVSADAELVEKLTARAEKIETAQGLNRRRYRVPVVIAAVVACVSLLAATPALAVRYEPAYKVMYAISPKLAQYFKPVELSCEDNGIEMTVLSSYIHDDTAEVYIAMRDLEGDRIDETVDLFDSEHINIPFDCSCNCYREGYDDKTKTATFKVTVKTMNGEEISNDKLTFSVSRFLSHKSYDDNVKIPYNLKNAHEASATQSVSATGYGQVLEEGEEESDFNLSSDKATVLVPTEPFDKFPVKGIDLTGVAYIDGKLHVQTAVVDNLKNDNHCSIYLKDKNGDIVQPFEDYDFDDSDSRIVDGRVDYNETVFDVSQSEIADYTLWGDFVTCDTLTEGNWSVTYQIENQKSAEDETDAESDENNVQELHGSLETKKDACETILNAVDYYDTVRGKIRTNLLNGDDYTIEYQVDMTDKKSTKSYEHNYSDNKVSDIEVYAFNGEVDADGDKLTLDHIEAYDNVYKIRNRIIRESTSKADSERTGDAYNKIITKNGIKEYKYRNDPTNADYASTLSIFPQEFGFELLSDFDKWELGSSQTYYGRLCRTIKGTVPENCSFSQDAISYSMLVDWSSGIILRSKFYDENGKLVRYMETKEISIDDDITVNTPDKDKYSDYKYDR